MDLILNKISLANKYINYKWWYNSIGSICLNKNIFATKICCNENLMVHEIRYNVTYKCNSSWKQVPLHRQTAVLIYNKVGNHFKTLIHRQTAVWGYNKVGIASPLRWPCDSCHKSPSSSSLEAVQCPNYVKMSCWFHEKATKIFITHFHKAWTCN